MIDDRGEGAMPNTGSFRSIGRFAPEVLRLDQQMKAGQSLREEANDE
jgi:hypothetical protein